MMDTAALLDYVTIMAVIAACWKLYDTILPPAAGADSQHTDPMPSLGAATGAEPAPVAGMPSTRLGEMLTRICAASGQGDVDGFLQGAGLAYELILQAFAAGDLQPVRHLLAADVAIAFDAVIEQRNQRDETMEQMFIGLRAVDVVDADFAAGLARIDVRFVGQMVTVVKNQAGQVVAGDPRLVVDVPEIWTFERDTTAPNAAWLLVATDADE